MGSKQILIVDDNEDVRWVFGAVLHYDGYEVTEAPDGAAGLTEALRLRPDLIVMDIAMPIMNGIEAASQIRADPSTADIPIVAITGNLFTAEETESLEGIFDRILFKPISPSKVLAEVQELIGPP